MGSIYPLPKRAERLDGRFSFDGEFMAYLECEDSNVLRLLGSICNYSLVSKEEANIKYLLDQTLREEQYELHIHEDGLTILASTAAGFYLATTSFKQYFSESMRQIDVYDEPDFKIRGFMYDISRNKVPTVKTVFDIIDIMESLKMNHLELYVEGFSFGYKSFEKFLTEEGYLSIEEYQEIEKYANDRFIDFVPNMNGFGHMSAWLAQDEYKELGEVEEPFFIWGSYRSPSTLNASDPRSIELVKQMYADMIPYMKSKYFNMNFDEPFEVGKGKTKELVEKLGEAKVYLDYTKKAYEIIKDYGKTPIIWGDVLIKHDDCLPDIPKDMIFAEWGYEGEHKWSVNLAKLRDAKIRFIAAPGTASWCTFAGRTDDAFENITSACIYAKMYGGEGILLTDWGDNGHLQPLSISMPSLVYAGLLMYRCSEGQRKIVREFCDHYVFRDDTHIITNLLIDLGNYYHYENDYTGNATQCYHVMRWAREALKQPKENQIKYYYEHLENKVLTLDHYEMFANFLAMKSDELLRSNVNDLVYEEVQYVINFVYTLANVLVAINDKLPKRFRKKKFKEVISACDTLILELEYVWLARNKQSSLSDSIENIKCIQTMAKLYLGEIK